MAYQMNEEEWLSIKENPSFQRQAKNFKEEMEAARPAAVLANKSPLVDKSKAVSKRNSKVNTQLKKVAKAKKLLQKKTQSRPQYS